MTDPGEPPLAPPSAPTRISKNTIISEKSAIKRQLGAPRHKSWGQEGSVRGQAGGSERDFGGRWSCLCSDFCLCCAPWQKGKNCFKLHFKTVRV